MGDDQLPIVYADESSNSGENLIDPHQPVFTMSAVRMETAEAAAIVAAARSKLPPQQGEPKFSSLAKSRLGREALTEAFAKLPAGSAHAYVVDKRFMTVAKMVDLLIVELAHADGLDMYADGSAVGLANLLYATGPVLGGSAEFDRMLATFVEAVRPNKPTTIDELFEAIEAYRATVLDGCDNVATMLLSRLPKVMSVTRPS